MGAIFAIDPGSEQSAFVLWDGKQILDRSIMANEELRSVLYALPFAHSIAIEMIASYGMAVGAEVFETCVWIGRFIEARPYPPPSRYFRRDIKLHLCQSARAKDANVRQALIDKIGPPGTKKKPGPTYGMKSHLWAALAVAIYAAHAEQHQLELEP